MEKPRGAGATGFDGSLIGAYGRDVCRLSLRYGGACRFPPYLYGRCLRTYRALRAFDGGNVSQVPNTGPFRVLSSFLKGYEKPPCRCLQEGEQQDISFTRRFRDRPQCAGGVTDPALLVYRGNLPSAACLAAAA